MFGLHLPWVIHLKRRNSWFAVVLTERHLFLELWPLVCSAENFVSMENVLLQMFMLITGTVYKCDLSHNDSHAIIQLNSQGSIYRVAVNIHSEDSTDVQYHLRTAEPLNNILHHRLTGVKFSYKDQGLKQSDFETIPAYKLFPIIQQYAKECNQLMVYGFYYNDGSVQGIHGNCMQF